MPRRQPSWCATAACSRGPPQRAASQVWPSTVQRRLQVQLARAASRLLGRGDDPALLDDLQRVDREDRLRPSPRPPPCRRCPAAAACRRSCAPSTVKSSSGPPLRKVRPARSAAAPGLVGELLVVGDVGVGAVEADRHVAASSCRCRRPAAGGSRSSGSGSTRGGCRRCARSISTASARPVAISAAGSPFGFGRCGMTTVPPWAWHASAQCGHRRLQRAAQLRLARPVGAPGHHRLLQAQQRQVAEQVLAVLLGGVDDRPAVARDGRPAVNSSVLVNRWPHCDCSRLTTFRSSPCASRCAPCVARKWTCVSPLNQRSRVHVASSACSRSVSSCWPGSIVTVVRSGSYSKPRATSTITSPRGSQPWQRAVDVGVGDLPQPQVAADVDVPGAEVRVDVVVVAVRLVRHALRRAEVDAAGDRPPGLVVQRRYVDPVAAAVDQLQPHARRLDRALSAAARPSGAVPAPRRRASRSRVAEGMAAIST